jgi:hypothetical protein
MMVMQTSGTSAGPLRLRRVRRWMEYVSWSALLALQACWDDDPCDPGQLFTDGACFDPPAGAGGPSNGGHPGANAGAGGDGGAGGVTAPVESSWGVTCSVPEECVGDSPLCAPAPLGYCTNIDCAPGEANAGICPPGWTCFPAGNGNPSACLNL